jgi:hypothetical protein
MPSCPGRHGNILPPAPRLNDLITSPSGHIKMMNSLRTSFPPLVKILALLSSMIALSAAEPSAGPKSDSPDVVYNFKDVDEEPLISATFFPDVLAESSAGKRFIAIFAVVIDQNGKLTFVKKLSASETQFGVSAELHIKRWRFVPATVGGKPVSCATILTMRIDVGDWHAYGRGLSITADSMGLIAVKPSPDGKPRPSEQRYARGCTSHVGP